MKTSLLTLLLLAFCRVAAFAADAPRPNVVFILVDDLRYDAFSAAAKPVAPWIKTPNIDRLAKEGARFDNAFVTTSLCSPSRASFLTGQYVHTHGIRGNEVAGLDEKLTTYAMLLKAAGYETAHVGKWHMDPHARPRPGFDHWVSWEKQGQYRDCPLNINGEAVPGKGYVTDVVTTHAVEFIRRKHDKPFVLNVWHKAVHSPFRPAGRHEQLYAGEKIPAPPSLDDALDARPALTRADLPEPIPAPPRKLPEDRSLGQLRCLAAVDESTGAVLKALEESGQLENTLVIFSSDNGYYWGEFGLSDKRGPDDVSLRVPLVMRWPRGIKAGATIGAMTLNIDLAPTLLELAGAPVPATMHGRSLAPLLKGTPPADWRKAALFEYFHEKRYPTWPTWQSVRTSDGRKFARYPKVPGAEELYDLRTDADERKNLAGDPAAATQRRELEAELDRLLRETGGAKLE